MADRGRPDAAWTTLAELDVTLADLERDARPTRPTFDGVTVVGMQATGDYWKPVYSLLEDAFEVRSRIDAARGASRLIGQLNQLRVERQKIAAAEIGSEVASLSGAVRPASLAALVQRLSEFVLKGVGCRDTTQSAVAQSV